MAEEAETTKLGTIDHAHFSGLGSFFRRVVSWVQVPFRESAAFQDTGKAEYKDVLRLKVLKLLSNT